MLWMKFGLKKGNFTKNLEKQVASIKEKFVQVLQHTLNELFYYDLFVLIYDVPP